MLLAAETRFRGNAMDVTDGGIEIQANALFAGMRGCRTGRRMIAHFLRSGSRAKERPRVVEPAEFWSAPGASPTVRGMLLGWSRLR